MLYAINVLKKIIMKEKSYILFWQVKKKMWILKHVCSLSYTLNYVLFDEISLLLLPYIPHPRVFNRCHRFTL